MQRMWRSAGFTSMQYRYFANARSIAQLHPNSVLLPYKSCHYEQVKACDLIVTAATVYVVAVLASEL